MTAVRSAPRRSLSSAGSRSITRSVRRPRSTLIGDLCCSTSRRRNSHVKSCCAPTRASSPPTAPSSDTAGRSWFVIRPWSTNWSPTRLRPRTCAPRWTPGHWKSSSRTLTRPGLRRDYSRMIMLDEVAAAGHCRVARAGRRPPIGLRARLPPEKGHWQWHIHVRGNGG